jgi:peptide/nickel transport system ATP-binding protein
VNALSSPDLDVRSPPLLSVEGLSVTYGNGVKAVDGVDLQVRAGETLAVVGESGCGKSSLGKLIMRIVEPTAGRIVFDGQDLTSLSRRQLRPVRRRFQMIFQDPFASLNPRSTVGDILATQLVVQGIGDRDGRRERVAAVARRVGLDASALDRYPHEFSGGQRQRIGIARALILEPELVVCDEPVSALDVSIRAQILNLLLDLQRERNLAYVFISHDMGVVEHVADRIAVMYLGRIVEIGETESVLARPAHPYTRALLASVPRIDPTLRHRSLPTATGDLPSPTNPPSGCHFHPRCPLATDICRRVAPALRPVRTNSLGACHHAELELPETLKA